MRREQGFTYLELIIATIILGIIAAAIIPAAEVTSKRAKEMELRRALRLMRDAIDNYKRAVDAGLIGGSDIKLGSEGRYSGGNAGQKAQVPAAHSHRSHDTLNRMGTTFLSR